MQVNCSLCGGENSIDPGQKMLFCSYCGSALRIEGGGREHLILPHERNDSHAEDALRSFLLGRNRARPKEMKTEFMYFPFATVEDDSGSTTTVPASDKHVLPGNVSDPPAGNYRFFDAEPAGKEKVIPVGMEIKGAKRILHLPVYIITYTSGGSSWKAAVIGESWQVVMDELPLERAVTVSARNLLAAAGLFFLYLVIGKLAPGWPGRFALIFSAAAAGFSFFFIRTKVLGKQ
jgi:hypothetical protein